MPRLYRSGYHLRHRHRSRARRHASGVIGRAYRRHRFRRRVARRLRGKVHRSVNKKTTVTRLGKRGSRNTVRKRLTALESGSKKHWDQISMTTELLSAAGTDLNPAGNSYSSLLAIQGPLCDGTAGNPFTPESEQRMNDTIFCKSVRIRGCLYGIRPLDNGQPDYPAVSFAEFGAAKMKQLCFTRMWITILQDMRPSLVDANGQSQTNPLPTTAGETPLESVYETLLTGTPSASQLALFGPENALRSYNSSRFKIIHQECHTTSMANYRKFFDINIKVNRKLKYVLPRNATPAPPNPPAVPYNYNLICMFTCNNPSVPLPWSAVLSSPILTQKTSRTYFVDS